MYEVQLLKNKNILLQVKILFWITLANFIAQIPYFLHLYCHKISDLLKLLNIPMLTVLIFFIIAYIMLFKFKRVGFWLMFAFLLTEFLFYLFNVVGGAIHGYGLFFHIFDTNIILKVVFIIGYVNFFASGYFLIYLFVNRKIILQ